MRVLYDNRRAERISENNEEWIMSYESKEDEARESFNIAKNQAQEALCDGTFCNDAIVSRCEVVVSRYIGWLEASDSAFQERIDHFEAADRERNRAKQK